jgi:hypothetical protein
LFDLNNLTKFELSGIFDYIISNYAWDTILST